MFPESAAFKDYFKNVMKKILLILFSTTVFSGCQQSTLDQQLVGAWTMEKVYEYENDVTEKHNPQGNRWIELKEDGTFISDGDPYGRNTGRWSVDNKNSILYIDSDVDDDDSEWKVSFEGDQVIWTGIGHPRKENTRLVHKRIVEKE